MKIHVVNNQVDGAVLAVDLLKEKLANGAKNALNLFEHFRPHLGCFVVFYEGSWMCNNILIYLWRWRVFERGKKGVVDGGMRKCEQKEDKKCSNLR